MDLVSFSDELRQYFQQIVDKDNEAEVATNDLH